MIGNEKAREGGLVIYKWPMVRAGRPVRFWSESPDSEGGLGTEG